LNIDRVKKIKIALIRRGWNQGDLSERLGISQAYLSLVLSGRRNVPWIWMRIFEELGLPRSGGRGPKMGDKE
jgi:transcriptional regulator with XRE-family HTH domain